MEREAWLILALVSVPETKYLTHWPFTFEKKKSNWNQKEVVPNKTRG